MNPVATYKIERLLLPFLQFICKVDINNENDSDDVCRMDNYSFLSPYDSTDLHVNIIANFI